MDNSARLNNELRAVPGAHFDAIVKPVASAIGGTLQAQPSKNYTTRYLLAAALAAGDSVVKNRAQSADSRALQVCLRQLGAELELVGKNDFRIKGVSGRPVLRDAQPINPGNAGAVLRFLLAVGAVIPEVTFTTDHPQSLGKRPNVDLLDALRQLGCESESSTPDGCLPITLRGGRLHGGLVTISGVRSSQFLSGLLFLSPLIGEDVQITVKDTLVSKAPIRQTLEVLSGAGIEIAAQNDLMGFVVKSGSYRAGEFTVNGDWPGSAALLAAAAVTGGDLRLSGLYDDQQGEKKVASVLREMGADVKCLPEEVRIRGHKPLSAVEFDGDLATDAVLALMGAACFAQGRSRFFNISNLRIKECDRISEPIAELRKLGVKCWEGSELNDPDPDAVIIEGNLDGYEGGVTVDGRDDHRVIMLLSIVALKCRQPVRIARAHQVSKSYPDYFCHLASLGAEINFCESTT